MQKHKADMDDPADGTVFTGTVMMVLFFCYIDFRKKSRCT